MDYSYTINKVLPKSEFMSVTYSADGYPDYRKNFNPVEFTQENLVRLIEEYAPHVVLFWERQASHPEDYSLEGGTGSAEALNIEQVAFTHAPTIEEQPEYDVFTQYVTMNPIENPMQKTVGWTVHDFNEEEQAGFLRAYSEDISQERNRLLAETDHWVLADTDSPTPAQLEYRQALRDIPQQEGFPKNIVWPTKP